MIEVFLELFLLKYTVTLVGAANGSVYQKD